MKIIKQGGLKDICKVIHSSLEGEMSWNKQYLIRFGCDAASILLKDNPQSFRFAIESGGIIDEIIFLLIRLPIGNINQFNLVSLCHIVNSSNYEQIKILVEKGILKTMNRTLNSGNELVQEYSVLIFKVITFAIGELEGEGKPHPLLKEMENDGTLTKLIEIFQNDKYNNKDINLQSACSIGYLYKATPIPIEFGSSIIIHLKDYIIKPNNQ
ncbi:MAG: hypothetical protein EZS28_009690, partial [Streblomastix strix]